MLGFKSMKTAYGAIKKYRDDRALCKNQASAFYYDDPSGSKQAFEM